MSTTPTWDLPLPEDGAKPWGDDYRDAMTTIDERLFAIRGSFFVEDNADETTFAGTDVPAKAVLTGAEAGPPCRFCDIDGNRLTYLGPLDRVPLVVAGFTVQAPANVTVKVSVRKNGEPVPGASTRLRYGPGITLQSGALTANVPMAADDYLELWVANVTGPQAVTVLDATVAARG